jgi:hypothetical protein
MRALLVCAAADQPSSFVLDLPTALWQHENGQISFEQLLER